MKRFNKIISFFLVGIIVFSQFSPLALALENELSINEPTLENTIDVKNNEIEGKGSLEVEMHFALPIANTSNALVNIKVSDELGNEFNVSLKDALTSKDGYLVQNGELGDQKITYTATKRDKDGHLLGGVDKNKNIVYFALNVNGLEKGTYNVELSGKNFVTYQKQVTIADYSERITLTDEKGMFEIGDINNDGIVNDIDMQNMLTAIKDNDLEKDLNLDGITNIADLNYITAIINSETKDAIIEKTNYIIDSNNVLYTSSNPIQNGELKDIFDDNNTVTLKPQNDGIISEDNPVSITLNFNDEQAVNMNEIRIATSKENALTNVKALVEDENGQVTTYYGKIKSDLNGIHLFTEEALEGSIIIDLKEQVAVKKVTIVITETSSQDLADIAKVEFLNNVKVETKEPEDFYTPKNIEIDNQVSEQLTVSFNSVPNVTGYEIRVNGPDKNNVVFQTTFTTFTIEDLKNYQTYSIEVQSVNQEWRSGWSSKNYAEPQATRRPPAPDMVEAHPTYGGIDFNWKDMKDTKSYNLYYREKGETEYKVIKNIEGNKYSLRNLKSQVNYEAYLTGNNDLGEGEASKIVNTTTLEFTAVIYPKYRLINNYDGSINRTTHINDVKYTLGNSYETDGENKKVPASKWSLVDDNYLSYWEVNDWQVNASASYNINAPIFILDQTYKMDEFVLTVPVGFPNTYKSGTYNENDASSNDTLVHYWNNVDNPTLTNKTTVKGVLTQKKDKNNQVYYLLKLQEPILANAVQFGLTVKGNNKPIQIAEAKFYEYDSLVDDVAKLFVDDLRVELTSGVTQQMIDELRARANEKHNGEYNPYREAILNDLSDAEKILNDENISKDVITMNPNISNSYDNLGFAMTINDYQPLGIAVRAGEQLTIYVGANTTDENINAEVVFTQVHAEANSWNMKVALKKGQNVITVPKIGSSQTERGGSVYVRFTSTPKYAIKIRVSGGVKIPVLDTTLLNNEDDKKKTIKEYIQQLDSYVNNLPKLYEEIYQDVNAQEKYGYDEKESAFGVTEIVTKYGILSFSAKAVLDAINAELSEESAKVNRLYEATEALDEMLLLFYRHKGLELGSNDSKNKVPSSRINIRYMTMFDGAFMYAGGYHIGIEYSSIAGVIQGKRNTDLETGYFGWGISHEVGHQINQALLAHAEVTNNVYALLAETANDKDKSRLEKNNIYEKIYEKVTSHTLGKDQNVFVTLGMYWQLHLAYDYDEELTTTFDDTNSIFARINKEARNYTNSNNYTTDELLILFASRAVKKDLSDYFLAWGLQASDKLKKELAKYEKEVLPIYYLNDQARRFRLSNQSGLSETNILSAKIAKQDNINKRVTLTFNVSQDEDKILGYEILRNGESIAFVTTNGFTDTIGAVNNRAFTYEVVAYDYLLNKTNTVTLDEIKISHDGSVMKNNFSITSNFKEENEIVDYEDATLDYAKLKVNNLIDDDINTGFKGISRISTLNSGTNPSMSIDNSDAYVIINLNTKLSLSGLKYKAYLNSDGSLDSNTIKNYKIEVRSDKTNWQTAKTGTFTFDEDGSTLVYFMKPNTDSKDQLYTFDDISYVRITSVGNKNGISGLEFDLIAPPGDNIDINKLENGEASISVLASDYCYLENGCSNDSEEGIIKEGLVVIQGTYAGSPSFNTVVIEDMDGNRYSGYQLIFANINSDMTVYDVANGTWLYVLTKDEYSKMVGKKIRAILYRSNDAKTFEGSRITSTSLATGELKPYDKLPSATIKGN